MSKRIENEPSSTNKEKPIYYDQYINVMIREFMDTNSKYGDKTNLMEELAKACGVSLSTMKRCKSGYSTLKKYKQIKGLADYTGFDFNKLIESVENKKVKLAKDIKRKIPDDLVINGVELHNKDSYNVLCNHTFRKGDLFPGRDNFLIFLDYMICEEKFIDTISDKAKDWKQIYAAVCGAGRALGFVCAPSLFQKIIARCIGQTSDISIYEKNRDILYRALTEYGYRCIKPDGAFYLFVEALEKDANAFSERAKEHELLLVPADSFGTPGYVRISYCVQTKQIEDALPAFKKLAESYQK